MAKSKLPRSTPAARPNQAPPPPKAPDAGSQSAKLSMPGGSTPPRSASPSSLNDADSSSLSASAKKKKKKSKARAKDSDYVDEHDFDLQAPNLAQRPRSPTSLAARAQAQAQLLAAASELYRRIEGDPQGIPDDDAYWTSLPAHLRTFIRNALPLGQFPPAAQAALEGNPNDPKNRHDSTKAMIAVAQQLAQAAHASQRHLQQYPSGNHAYPPLPFDPSIFADPALHPDQPMPPLSHPTSNSTQHATTNGTYAQYSSSPNPPPTQPPVEPLPPPVVLYNNFEDDADRYDDRDDGEEYCSYDELEADAAMLDPQGNLLRHRNGVWVHDDSDHVHGPNGTAAISDGARTSSKSNKKKKKKKKASSALNPADDDLHDAEPEAPIPPKPVPSHPTPTTNVSSVNRGTNPPPPSSRAAGKQPMTFNSNSKSTARPMNGTGTLGKRPVSSSAHGQLNPTVNNAKIWSTSSAEERERIKEFWLGLSMKDRQKLVQVEKETVLKKMKEQQRHLCSCAVCGRKRSAIEDELEVLYDAYYDELEDYANHQQRWVTSGGTIPPPPGPGPFPGSVALDSSGAVIGGDPLSKARGNARDGRHSHSHHHHHHHHGQQRSALHPESSDGYDDEELDDDADYDDEDDDADYDDEDEEDDLDLERERVRDDFHKRAPVVPAGRRRGADDNDLFGLGNSLTVKGGILTVADDMLKNDGRKFLEMMEQLAERRMHREELTGAELALDDEDEDDDHPDDLDDEDDLEDDEDEEEDNILTDEQRMEEGRKMFQIFAARMFEQRVLQAYRERVAQERQLQLLRELEEEDSNEKAREARRQKETQKKKDKKKAQKEAKDAEKNRKDLEKAAAEAEVRAQLQAVRDAELKKQEEIRLKKEAERKLKDEEKAKKDEEKRRRLAEERERELERERKRKEKEEKARLEREALEQAKRDKEEEARKVKEEQERVQREKVEKERKAKEEQERKSDALKKEKEAEAKAQAQRDAKQAASTPAAPARTTPVSPAGARSAASKSPGPVHAQAGRNAKSGSIPSSPAVPPSTTRAAGGSRGGAAQKFATTSMPPGLIAAPASSASTLPAPPQGLPPRPSTAVLTPTGTVSQGSSVSVAASAGLPRPPVNSGVPTSMPPLGFGSIGVASPNAPSHVPQAPTSMSPQLASSFAHDKSHPTSHAHSAIGAPGTRSADSYSSPTLPNGMAAGSGGESGMPPGLGGMASGLASLNLGGNSMHPGMSMASAPGQSTFSPIGSGQDALRSRTTSFADTDPMAAFGGMRPSSSTAQRANYRPSQPAPIGPIGRPKAVDAIHQEDHAGHFGNGRSSSNTSGSGATSPRLPEGILGSSALGGDDDIIDPKPRRTSHTIPIGGGATGSSAGGGFYGAGGPVGGGGGFGMGPASSPWSSFSAGGGGAQSAQGPLSPAFNSGSGPGAIGSTAFAPGPGAGSAGMAGAGQPDPWSRAPTSWDRARYAFEQPGGSGAGSGSSSGLGSIGGALHGSGPQPPQHHSLGMAPGSSPFGLGGGAPPGPRNLFGAPGSGGSAHPGAIGALPSALSPTSSAASRHLGGKHD